jgi:pimeloyl-ACP methyl ester carboxylesterase
MIKNISFKNHKGIILRGFIHIPKRYDTAILTLHGFPGSSLSKRVVKTANLLEKKGFLVMRFDFSGSNISDGRFEDKLMSTEVREIKCAIDFLKKNYKFKQLILHGHSTGAIDASLYAHKDKRISKLVLSGAVDDLKDAAHIDFKDWQVKDFWTKGYITYTSKKHWSYKKRLKKAFYDEFFTLDIPKSMKRYKRPLLLVHGDKDDAVPLVYGLRLYKLATKPKKLVIIKGCDHQFSKKQHMQQFINAVVRFTKS